MLGDSFEDLPILCLRGNCIRFDMIRNCKFWHCLQSSNSQLKGGISSKMNWLPEYRLGGFNSFLTEKTYFPQTLDHFNRRKIKIQPQQKITDLSRGWCGLNKILPATKPARFWSPGKRPIFRANLLLVPGYRYHLPKVLLFFPEEKTT